MLAFDQDSHLIGERIEGRLLMEIVVGPGASALSALVGEIVDVVLIAVLVQIPAVRQAFGIAIPSAADLVMVVIEASKVILRRYTATLVTK